MGAMTPKEFAAVLRRLSKDGAREAARGVLNDAASRCTVGSGVAIKQEFTLRNQFTERSLRTQPARQKSLKTLRSESGTVSPYLDTQEEGGSKSAKNGSSVVLPTKAASREGAGGGPRKALPKGANRLEKIELNPRPTTVNPRNPSKSKPAIQALLVAIRTRAGNYIYWEPNPQRRGIWRVYGGKPKPGGKLSRFRLSLIHDLSHSSVAIPRHTWAQGQGDAAMRQAVMGWGAHLESALRGSK